jgi:hypothetical protein
MGDDPADSPHRGEGRLLWGHIRQWCDETGATPASVASRMGVSAQTLNNWRDKPMREVPRQASLLKLARAIRRPYEEILAAALVDAELLKRGQMDDFARQVRRMSG